MELNDFATDPAQFMAEIEKRLKKHGAAMKLIPPAAVLRRRVAEERDRQLRLAASDWLDEHLDLEAMRAQVVTKAKNKLSIPNVPAELVRWAKKLPAESWSARVELIVRQSIGRIDSEISDLAEEAIEDR
ncbi:MAG: hypothetical protein ABR915_04160 [Thermoguttaceae bacterium]